MGAAPGIECTVAHPDPQRNPTELVVCDRMQTASFAIIAATLLREVPRVPEANWEHLAYPTPPAQALDQSRESDVVPAEAVRSGAMQASFDTGRGLRCTQLSVAGLEQALACTAAPIFEVRVSGSSLSAQDWSLERTESVGAGKRFMLRHAQAKLAATVECTPGVANELLLRMALTNESDQPMTATLRFPILRGLRVGNAADTWYLSGKRGGIINFADVALSDPLGERHPIQMDGFFNRARGWPSACSPTTPWPNITSSTYPRAVKAARGQSSTPTVTWRPARRSMQPRQHRAARRRLARDLRRVQRVAQDLVPARRAAKPWFERIFALSSGNAHYDAASDPQTRGNVQRLVDTMQKYIGPCDYVHLFGWGTRSSMATGVTMTTTRKSVGWITSAATSSESSSRGRPSASTSTAI